MVAQRIPNLSKDLLTVLMFILYAYFNKSQIDLSGLFDEKIYSFFKHRQRAEGRGASEERTEP